MFRFTVIAKTTPSNLASAMFVLSSSITETATIKWWKRTEDTTILPLNVIRVLHRSLPKAPMFIPVKC